MTQAWPLTGRATELRLVRAAVAGGGMVLAGVGGVGRTRLARAAADAALATGSEIRWAAASASARTSPLAAFAPLVGPISAGTISAGAASTLRRAAAALAGTAPPGRVLLVVDDAHLLDELSAALVHQLVLERRVAVLLTVRSGTTCPDAVTAVWKDLELPRLDLAPLSVEHIRELLEAVLGGPVEGAAVQGLCAMTRQSLTYLRQLVEGEFAAGRLRPRNGVWSWIGDPRLSPELEELVRGRMGDLPPRLQGLVEFLAFGEPLGLADLAALGIEGRDVERAEQRHLVEVVTAGRRVQIRLAHPLFAAAQRAACTELRARTVRLRLADALARTGCRRIDDDLRHATLAVDAGHSPDANLLTRAAQRAMARDEVATAERLARAAIAAGGRFEARVLLTAALGRRGSGPTEAEFADLRRHARTDEELVRATIVETSWLFWAARRPRRALRILADAQLSVTEAGAAAELLAIGALFGALQCEFDVADKTATELLSGACSDRTKAFGASALLMARAARGRVDQLNVPLRQAVAAAPTSADTAWLAPAATVWSALALQVAGRLAEAEAGLAAARITFGAHPGAAIALDVAGGCQELAAGRARAAARLLRDARAGLERWGEAGAGWRHVCLINLTRALALAGDLDGARQAAAELTAAEHPGNLFLLPEVSLARAWVAAVEGSLSRAQDLACEAARDARAKGQRGHEVLALHSLVRFGDSRSADCLAGLCREVGGPRAPAAAAHASALDRGDGPGLEAASAALERIGDLLGAADAAAHSASAHARTGRIDAARTASARALTLRDRCGGAQTPALAALTVPVPLTAREREVFMLAARGLSNVEIADRLVLSVRTVEGHRYRGSGKLGTGDLSEIADLLGVRSAPPNQPPRA